MITVNVSQCQRILDDTLPCQGTMPCPEVAHAGLERTSNKLDSHKQHMQLRSSKPLKQKLFRTSCPSANTIDGSVGPKLLETTMEKILALGKLASLVS